MGGCLLITNLSFFDIDFQSICTMINGFNNPGLLLIYYCYISLAPFIAMLTIRLLGNFQFLANEQPVRGFNSPRLQSFLAYLILNSAAPLPRRQLAFLFWPDNSEEQARTNLRKFIHFLRQALPDPDVFLISDGKTLQWNSSAPYQLDVAQLQAAAVAGDQERVISLYTGDLLLDCYDEWILTEREHLRQIYLHALDCMIQQKERDDDYPSAIGFSQQLLQNDPLREEIHRGVMRLLALNGDRAAALQAYKHCATILQAELGIEPSQATRQVYLHLLKQQERPIKASLLADALPLVGRSTEWACVQENWRMAAQGKPRLLLISGEAGIGKTRLVEEMQSWIVQKGFFIFTTRCYALETSTAYAPVTAWLRDREPVSLEPVWLAEVARLMPELAETAVGFP